VLAKYGCGPNFRQKRAASAMNHRSSKLLEESPFAVRCCNGFAFLYIILCQLVWSAFSISGNLLYKICILSLCEFCMNELWRPRVDCSWWELVERGRLAVSVSRWPTLTDVNRATSETANVLSSRLQSCQTPVGDCVISYRCLLSLAAAAGAKRRHDVTRCAVLSHMPPRLSFIPHPSRRLLSRWSIRVTGHDLR